MANDDRGPRPPSLAGSDWLVRPETQSVLSAIAAGGYEARIVGGAVRNALLGEPVKDIDVAATAEPPEVIRLAEAAGLRAAPTGIEHGTVTVIAHHSPIEVTTLRRDIETFGRHARVTFTTDWTEDARRRDFTINALYCSADGTVHDPLSGYADLVARRVRFIGDPHDRIREDYLRILRFFRFTAEYADGDPDAAGLAASIELAPGIQNLSAERIRAELLRLLAAPRAVETVRIMDEAGIVERVLGTRGEVKLLARVVAIEQAIRGDTDALLRLAALAGARPGVGLALRDRLKLSGIEFERLARMGLPDRAFDPATPEREARAFLYRHGSEAFTDGAILAWARSGDSTSDAGRRARLALPTRWPAPELPVRGADVMALGVPEGPAIGRVVRAFEDWWIDQNFPDDPAALTAALKRLAKSEASH